MPGSVSGRHLLIEANSTMSWNLFNYCFAMLGHTHRSQVVADSQTINSTSNTNKGLQPARLPTRHHLPPGANLQPSTNKSQALR